MDRYTRLKQEIAMYSALLEEHKKHQELKGHTQSSQTSNAAHTGGNIPHSPKRRTVVLSSRGNPHQKNNRVVVKPHGESNRAALNPAAHSTLPSTTSAASTSGSHNMQKTYTNRSVHVNYNRHGVSVNDASSQLGKSRYTWRNPSIKTRVDNSSQLAQSSSTNSQSNSVSSPSKLVNQSTNPKHLSRFKLVKRSVAGNQQATSVPAPSSSTKSSALLSTSRGSDTKKRKLIGKYKLISESNSSTGNTPYLSKSSKRLISRYKITRRSSERKGQRHAVSQHTGASPLLPKSKRMRRSLYKLDRRRSVSRGLLSRYKIDKLAHIRKKTMISSRTQKLLTNQYRWQQSTYRHVKTYVSHYKFEHYKSTPLKKVSDATSEDFIGTRRQTATRQLASRVLQRSAAVSIRAKYKKNNTNDKHCMFFMRFGKCKRGDKCFYIHDRERVAVCSRYLRGTCSIENCPFSHEAKKEKVPVCLHFLRGCCVRDHCPYLHVNVGKNAPICQSFAERRYCHLGEKCKKLHTDVCPSRDKTGKCPKGSRCHLRHPKKLPQQRERSLLKSDSVLTLDDKSKTEEFVVPKGEKLTNALPAFIALDVGSRRSLNDSPDVRPEKKLKTKPSFLE